jgi:uncharacterized membrane protein
MSTPASIAGHPLHPMLVTIPIGLWVFALVADLIGYFGASAEPWNTLAFYALLGGEIGAVAAALPGLLDFGAVRERGGRAARVVAMHLGLNLVVVGLVALNLALRWESGPGTGALALSVVTVALLGVSGWLGGELVHVLGVTVTARPHPSGIVDPGPRRDGLPPHAPREPMRRT